MDIKEGLYEQIINNALKEELNSAEGNVDSDTSKLDDEEASNVLSSYISDKIEHTLQVIHEKDKTNISRQKQAKLINDITDYLNTYDQEDSDQHLAQDPEDESFEMLDSVVKKKNSSFGIRTDQLPRPETSVASSSLFTGALAEPKLYQEFQKEIASSDSIDMLVSFIRWSGIVRILPQLREFGQRGGKLRVITTTYTGSTEAKAVEELSKIPGCQIKISYNTKSTRLHAKAYIFHRNTGFTTAYVGSSNLSSAAITNGLEWNMKITERDLPETFLKINAAFTSYWNSPDFEEYHESVDAQKLRDCLDRENHRNNGNGSIELKYQFDIHPYSFQKEILDKLDAERKVRGSYRNLVVAATGTGKTVISAFDYQRYVKEHPGQANRLLFIAHREEILKQSLSCFRGVLKDQNFGDLLVGKFQNPDHFDHLFASIQSINSNDLMSRTPEDYYDFIIIDESHHDAASSYQKVLSYYKPKILLGLTATPERADGKSILEYFDNHIAAEIRLPEAIDRGLLVPFQYFAVSDVVDLDNLDWQNGGYVKAELEQAYIGNPLTAVNRADAILSAVNRYVADLRDVKCIGFCVSKKHAEYMADYFRNHYVCTDDNNENNVVSIALTSDTDPKTRQEAIDQLKNHSPTFIFTVDLFNEGVDIPQVNTILFLRPTESLTIFLQQLGRGLRLSDHKEYLTVLDFIGQANKHYNFEERYTALLEKSHRDLMDEMKEGFLYLPKGCSIIMEKMAQKHVLDNIKASYQGSLLKTVERKMRTFTSDYGMKLNLANFFDQTHIDPRNLYEKSTFYLAEADAGLRPAFHEKLNEKGLFAKALQRVSWIDSRRWIDYLLSLLKAHQLPEMPDHNTAEYRMLNMFQYTIWNQSYQDCHFDNLMDGIRVIQQNQNCCEELIELLEYQKDHIDFVDQKVDLGFDCPLDLHCCYNREQLFSALDFDNPKQIHEGVKYLPEKKLDVLLVTLNKSSRDYSPTTMYNDYSENEYLFHWQSQSTTSDTSKTGQRYIHHKEMGSKVLLFVRENKKRNQKYETEPYAFLGTAEYVSHTGSRPMNILWKLDEPIPGKYLRRTNKLYDA